MRARRSILVLLAIALLCRGLPGQSLRFAVIGDGGTGDDQQKRVLAAMAARHAKHPWKLALLAGDNIYEDGNPEYFAAKFREPFKTLVDRGVVIHSALGNHDRVHPAARLGCAQVEEESFGYAGKRDEYVLEEGPVVDGRRLARFLVINSSAWIDQYVDRSGDKTACRGASEDRRRQLERWLGDSARYHWNILVSHHPLYSYVFLSGLLGGHGSSKGLRDLIEPLLKGRVDVVFAGHDHFYQRIKPHFGIQHFVTGGGAKLRFGGNFRHRDVAYGAKRRHFLDIELTRDELRFWAVDEEGREFDSGSVRKAPKR